MKSESQHRAIVLGATGAVGANIVKALVQSPSYVGVTTIGRRIQSDLANSNAKLTQHIVDVFDPKSYDRLLPGHSHAFCAFGIGQPSKTHPEDFQKVDIDAVLHFAAACHAQGVRHISVMTSVGSNPKSSIRYLRLKGELEKDIAAMGFPRTSFFRPSMLITPNNRYGLMQGILLKATPLLDPFLLGPLSRYRSIKVSELGTAMVLNADTTGQGLEILEWKDFKRISKI